MNTREKLLTCALAIVAAALAAVVLTVLLRAPESFEIARQLAAIERRLEHLDTQSSEHETALLQVAAYAAELNSRFEAARYDELRVESLIVRSVLVVDQNERSHLVLAADAAGGEFWMMRPNFPAGERKPAISLTVRDDWAGLDMQRESGRVRVGLNAPAPYLLFTDAEGRRLVPDQPP